MAGTNPKPDHICLHAWTTDEDGNQSWTDQESETQGWCVYNFHEGMHSDPSNPLWTGEIDMSGEQDFATEAEAWEEANKRAAQHGVEVQTY